ncbi:L,D-transpeptidase [Pseudolabrys sp. Root1462]|jgi:lipoprotein-anchoring transpeptidase ErfK/SrfK|uniref:L,D-transpeptidase n=1 Tax=Pseudolabrys sp. Root1462 TaxID=1736466 RepID=UPI000AAEB3B6|nr:L,D-transpeptidase [Pseudolabrys sp. Root1462]
MKRPKMDLPDSATVARLSRRAFTIGLPLFVAGCVTADYGSVNDGGHSIAAVENIDPSLARTEVSWNGNEKPGTIVVNVPQRRLYLVEAGGKALRYSVGVGRSEALNFRGSAVIGRKEQWPRWTPTANMMHAIPRYRAYAGGMAGGPDNPLGPRALYLYRNGHDTYFRLHGTTEPETIGTAVSSGCIRLYNQDILDLYSRVPVGTQVKVVQG